MSTQSTLQMAATQIQQQQFGLIQQGQPAPAHQGILPQPPQQQIEDQLQQQQHILGYAQQASMGQQVSALPVMLPSQPAHRIPPAGATTVINGLPYQLQMNSDGTQVWVPIVSHTMTSYTMPTMMSMPSTTFQNVGATMQNDPTSVNLQQQQQ